MVGCVAALAVLLTYAYSPRGYAISEGAIVVKRLIGDARFPLEGLREARRTTADDLRWCMRLWGTVAGAWLYRTVRRRRVPRRRARGLNSTNLLPRADNSFGLPGENVVGR